MTDLAGASDRFTDHPPRWERLFVSFNKDGWYAADWQRANRGPLLGAEYLRSCRVTDFVQAEARTRNEGSAFVDGVAVRWQPIDENAI